MALISKACNRVLEYIPAYNYIDVNEDSIYKAITLCLERSKTLVEGAGALPVAAMMENDLATKNDSVCLPLCGGNIDMLSMSPVLLKGLKSMERYAEIEVRLSDSPGSLESVLPIVSDTNANIQSIEHNRTSDDSTVRYADVKIGMETTGSEHLKDIIELLNEKNTKKL